MAIFRQLSNASIHPGDFQATVVSITATRDANHGHTWETARTVHTGDFFPLKKCVRRQECRANRVNPKIRVPSTLTSAFIFRDSRDDKPLVLVSPKIKVCLECAVAEFAIPESELRRLKEGENAAA